MRVAGHSAAQVLCEIKGPGVEPYAFLPLPGGDVIEIGDQVQVLDAAHELIQIRVIGKKGGDGLGGHWFCAHIVAVDSDGSLGKAHHAGHCPEGCGLTCAIVADKAANLSGGDVKVQIPHSGFAAGIGFGVVCDVQHGSALLCVF